MSPNQRSTDDLLRRYLNGALTASEEAELERRALTDGPLKEAMRGLQAHPKADHEAHVAQMLRGVREQAANEGASAQVQGEVGGAKIRPLRRDYGRFAAAASVVLLLASALWFLPRWMETEPNEMAMKTPTAPAATEQTITSAAAQPAPEAIETTTPEVEAEAPRIAPSSSTPNLRPRPDAVPAVPLEAAGEAQRRQQNPERSKPEEATRGKIAADANLAGAAPAPVAPVAPAPTVAPASVIAQDQSAGLLKANTNAPEAAPAEANSRNYLEGRITNENGVPIKNALVRLPGLPLGERTDSSGYFRLSSDATTTRIEVSHPDYESETVDFLGRPTSLQVSLDRKEWQPERPSMVQDVAQSLIILDNKPGYAAPLESYATLRKRLESEQPAGLPKGKVKFSFTVNTDGTLTDFEFRGSPNRAVMDYIGTALVQTSVWEITQGEEPVRVYMKVVL